MLDSEIAGGVAGRSTTNFTHDDRVNDQNSHRHDHGEHEIVNVMYNSSVITEQTNDVYSFGDERHKCQADDDFLCSLCRTQQLCLFTFIVSFELTALFLISRFAN